MTVRAWAGIGSLPAQRHVRFHGERADWPPAQARSGRRRGRSSAASTLSSAGPAYASGECAGTVPGE